MDAFLQDVRYGFRQLIRQRGSSLVAVITLALGIGVSTAIFSIIDATMLRPLPYPHPEQLVDVSPEETMPDGRVSRATASMEDMRLWQQSDDIFAMVAGTGSAFRGRIVVGDQPERIAVTQFTEDYLPMLGVTPLIGRNFTREETDPGAPLVALLGYGYWTSHYDGRADVVGQTVRFDTEVATIIGVLPASFNARTPVCLPLRTPVAEYSRRGTGRVSVTARLRPDVTIEQAQERLSARMPIRTLPGGEQTRNPHVSVRSQLQGELRYYRTTINVLAGSVALILLIACVNVAGLLLARGAARQSELAVRASLGAGRGRLIRQLLTESTVLGLLGGALGVLLAWLSLDGIAANIPLSLPANSPVALNLWVLGATAALLVPTTLLFGLAPAIRLSRVQIGSVLARSGRQRSTALSRRGGQLLIAAEVALAVILVTGAGLMIRSFMRIAAVDLGFARTGLVVMDVLPLDQNPAVHQEYYASLLQQIRAVPGIASAGIVDNFTLGAGTTFSSINVAGKTTGGGATMFRATPGYFETIGAVLLAGRLPTDTDSASGLRGVVINDMAARNFFDGSAVGREFTRIGPDQRPWMVIGVIQNLRHGGPLSTRQEPQIFFPLQITQYDLNTAMMVVMRPTDSTSGLSDQLRRLAQSLGPRVLVERIRTSEEMFGTTVLNPRRRTVLLGLLGGLGLALALVGVFGMTAYSVTRRTAEIGVRLAFGARPTQVVRAMVRDSAVPIIIGTVLGLGGAWLATGVIRSFLFATEPTDPATLATVAVTLAVAGGLAALVPALRAARVDPATSLRTE
ncbi:MAG TPA: ADOP family duplicated permease [Vicinamibacterales bacterium]|nr:ADOP family duplicated permease [Vicinamibacterales bacterium]